MEYIQLSSIYPENDRPDRDDLFWEVVTEEDFDSFFGIAEVNPVEFANRVNKANGETLLQIFKDHAEPWQKKLVKALRRNIRKVEEGKPLLMSGGELIDGNHRMVALALEGVTKMRVMDLMLDQPDQGSCYMEGEQ